MKKTKFRRLVALVATTGLAASLAACGREDAQHSQAPAALAAGPVAQAGWSMNDLAGVDPAFLDRNAAPLPEAVPMRASYSGHYGYAPAYDYGPQPYDDGYYVGDSGPDDYQWLALASALGGMLGYAPPDYGFYYDGVQPWAWETGDRYLRYAEPIYGGYRYYYYEPDSYSPFLVSDPYYSYGYRDDRLVTIYDRSGRVIDADRAAQQRRAALDYFARAQALYRAGHSERHLGVAASLWQDHRDTIARAQRDWDDARGKRPAWQSWDARNEQRLHRDWASEALVRREAESSFAGWQKADFRTPAPRFYSPQQRQAQLQKVAAIRSSPQFAAQQRMRQEKLAAQNRQAAAERRAAVQRVEVARRDDAARRQQQRQDQAQRIAPQEAPQAQHAKVQQEQRMAVQQKAQEQRVAAQQHAQHAAQQKQVAARQARQRQEQAQRAAQQHRQQASREAAQRRQHAQAASRAHEQQAQQEAQRHRVQQAAQQRQAHARQAAQRHEEQQARAAQQQRHAQAQQVRAVQQQRQAQARQASQRKEQQGRVAQQGQGRGNGGGHGHGRDQS